MTVHCGNDPKRKPLVKDGVVYPLEGTDGYPKKISRFDERGKSVEREFDGKTYKIKKDKDGFPEFTIFETYLGKDHINTKDHKPHFEESNAKVKYLLEQNEGLAEQMGLTPKQVKFFQRKKVSKGCPPGLTWHHHQDTGKMQLVNTILHDRFNHVGGMEVWGGSRP